MSSTNAVVRPGRDLYRYVLYMNVNIREYINREGVEGMYKKYKWVVNCPRDWVGDRRGGWVDGWMGGWMGGWVACWIHG